jgi:hypothetical protein
LPIEINRSHYAFESLKAAIEQAEKDLTVMATNNILFQLARGADRKSGYAFFNY